MGSDCAQCEQHLTSVSHFIHTVEKLTLHCAQRDVGLESDCGVDGSVPAVAGDLPILTDPAILIADLIIISVVISIRLL